METEGQEPAEQHRTHKKKIMNETVHFQASHRTAAIAMMIHTDDYCIPWLHPQMTKHNGLEHVSFVLPTESALHEQMSTVNVNISPCHLVPSGRQATSGNHHDPFSYIT